jgi:hypothetical protein
MHAEEEEEFEHWLAEMGPALERFLHRFPAEARSRMDYSVGSLDDLERWLLGSYAGTDDLLKPDAKEVVDGLSRYVGETYRRTLGGHWQIRYDDPDYAFYGLPELTGFSSKATPICPHTLVTACADRRTGVYLRTVLENARKRIAK